MKQLEKYLFNILSNTFFPIFLILFTITSIIFLVKIAALTSIIQMSFYELLKLYSYSLPTILFYTLPIAYFISMVISIAKLSSEYETIILTSFGLNPIKIVQKLLPITMLVSLSLLILSLGLFPKAKYLKAKFMSEKKQEAQFNIKPSEYGQQFGSWLIYVNKSQNSIYEDITLLQVKKNKDIFISANKATMKNNDRLLNLSLQKGKSFIITDNITQIDFNKMLLNHQINQPRNIKSLKDIVNYWDDRKTDLKKSELFTFYILISLFPLLSILFILTIGYFNPRYDNNKSGSLSITLIIIFIVIINKYSAIYPNAILYYFPIIWIFFSYTAYYFTVKKLY